MCARHSQSAPIFHPCGVVCFVYRKEADVRTYIVTELWGRGVSAICGALRRRVYTCRDTKQPPMLNSLNAILRQDRHPRHHARLAASCCCYRRRFLQQSCQFYSGSFFALQNNTRHAYFSGVGVCVCVCVPVLYEMQGLAEVGGA